MRDLYALAYRITSDNLQIVDQNALLILNVLRQKHVWIEDVKIRVQGHVVIMLNVEQLIILRFVIAYRDFREIRFQDVKNVSNI